MWNCSYELRVGLDKGFVINITFHRPVIKGSLRSILVTGPTSLGPRATWREAPSLLASALPPVSRLLGKLDDVVGVVIERCGVRVVFGNELLLRIVILESLGKEIAPWEIFHCPEFEDLLVK